MAEISHESLLESLFDGVYYVDRNRKITVWNSAAERITGFAKAEVLGHCCADNILRHVDEQGHELCVEGCPLAACLQDGKVRETNIYLHHKQGHRVPATVRVSPVRDASGVITGCVEVFSDNSSAEQIIRELESLKKEVYLDPLTGIGNRRYAEMMHQTRFFEWQNHGVPYGVIFLDIDHFKRFNDSYGHKTGDEVLVMVAKTISHLLRRMDVVARWGGEEFVVLVQNSNRDFLAAAAERLRLFIERSFLMVAGEPLTVTVSIGATVITPHDSQESIMERADQLMYASKTHGRNRVTCG